MKNKQFFFTIFLLLSCTKYTTLFCADITSQTVRDIRKDTNKQYGQIDEPTEQLDFLKKTEERISRITQEAQLQQKSKSEQRNIKNEIDITQDNIEYLREMTQANIRYQNDLMYDKICIALTRNQPEAAQRFLQKITDPDIHERAQKNIERYQEEQTTVTHAITSIPHSTRSHAK